MQPLFAVTLLLCIIAVTCEEQIYPCDSDIFCYGDILHSVQMSSIYGDSKHFVDMPMKHTPDVVKKNFKKIGGKKANKKQLAKFLEENFNEPGEAFTKDVPDDWKENPAFLEGIKDQRLRSWAIRLHELWKTLGRIMSDKVKTENEKYSLVYVPNTMVVPGGRFREFYYWDSFWTMKGLIVSDMGDTVKGMLDNFIVMVKKYGFVPNGGRKYYTKRSQPPYLIPMVKLYFDETNDLDFIRDNIGALEREYQFWVNNRTTSVRKNNNDYQLAVYRVDMNNPRPESYKEDVHSASKKTKPEKQKLYRELASGAESGWDYSTRWFIKNKTNDGTMADLKTHYIIPVDLNSLLCYNARMLRDFYNKLGDTEKVEIYNEEIDLRKEAIEQVLWNEARGVWQDYDNLNGMHRDYFYVSNLHPLWSQCYSGDKEDKVLSYVTTGSDALKYSGGVPTSLKESGQQWDFPNGWPNIQQMMIQGLDNLSSQKAKDLAFQLAQRWINTNYDVFARTGHMFEKYNVAAADAGHGGEYNVQIGFGWSNGVALDFLHKWGDRLTSNEPSEPASHAEDGSSASAATFTPLLLVLATLCTLITSL